MPQGIFTCSCHPFETWKDVEKAYKQKFKIGDKVRHRCTQKEGVIIEPNDQEGFVKTKYGKYQRDIHLDHAQELVKIN